MADHIEKRDDISENDLVGILDYVGIVCDGGVKDGRPSEFERIAKILKAVGPYASFDRIVEAAEKGSVPGGEQTAYRELRDLIRAVRNDISPPVDAEPGVAADSGSDAIADEAVRKAAGGYPSTDFELELTPAQAAVAAKAVRTMVDLRSGRLDVLLGLFDDGTIPLWREEREPPQPAAVRDRFRNAFAAAVAGLRRAVRDRQNFDPAETQPHASARASVEKLAEAGHAFADASASGDDPCLVVVPADVAHQVDEALEFFSRLGIGQTHEVHRVLYDAAMTGRPYDSILSQAIEDAAEDLRTATGFRSGHSYGVGSDRILPELASCWEIHKALQLAIAMDRDPKPSFRDVRYDGNSLRWTQGPEPICRPVAEPAAAPGF